MAYILMLQCGIDLRLQYIHNDTLIILWYQFRVWYSNIKYMNWQSRINLSHIFHKKINLLRLFSIMHGTGSLWVVGEWEGQTHHFNSIHSKQTETDCPTQVSDGVVVTNQWSSFIVVTVELPLAYLQASHVQSYFRVDSVSWWTLGLCVTLQATVFGGLMQIYGIKNNNHRTQVFYQTFSVLDWNVRRVTFLPLTKEITSTKLNKELTTP